MEVGAVEHIETEYHLGPYNSSLESVLHCPSQERLVLGVVFKQLVAEKQTGVG